MLKRLIPNVRCFATKHTVNQEQLETFKELSKQWWNTNHKGTRILHSFNDLRVPWITEQLTQTGLLKKSADKSTPLAGISFLEVGCGGGILTEPLSRLGGNVTGLDCNEDMFKTAVDHNTENDNFPNLRYVLSTIEEYSVGNKNKYDVVIASETIEHVEEQDFFLKCCIECLKPGGSIFITTNSKSLFSRLIFINLFEDILHYIPKGGHKYDMFIDIEDMKSMFKRENCNIVFSSGMIYNMFTVKWYWIKNPYIMHYAIHAVKSNATLT
ncbi:hypothetical protein Zmor_011314 [Zophobas morio]|uniref:Ubiquinone biosynthesis O-methyltransferase, mitochondrial n=1 Tax=Zophobas morio TaxID=2755281 RepID=A0AA38IT01_9CUCU|nr:hypothetical protein Zmor_011314 [Zophobas morio]